MTKKVEKYTGQRNDSPASFTKTLFSFLRVCWFCYCFFLDFSSWLGARRRPHAFVRFSGFRVGR